MSAAQTVVQVALAENVASLKKLKKHRAILEKWVKILVIGGYAQSLAQASESTGLGQEQLAEAVRSELLDAADHGSAQHRCRLFIVAVRRNALDDGASLLLWQPPAPLPTLPLRAFLLDAEESAHIKPGEQHVSRKCRGSQRASWICCVRAPGYPG